MRVDELIKEISKQTNKDNYLKERIKVKYVPYETKMARCEQIINISSYIKVGEKLEYRVNTPARYVLTSLTLINEYTDIDIDFSGDSFLTDYNQLDENGLIDGLISIIPNHERETWTSLMGMMCEDKQENERSLISYLDTKFEALSQTLLSAMTVLQELSSQELTDNE